MAVAKTGGSGGVMKKRIARLSEIIGVAIMASA
jgi:hypothetical protein